MLVCPTCNLELRPQYNIRNLITSVDHKNGKCTGKPSGIGQFGKIDNTPQISKKQQQIHQSQAAQAKSGAHHVAQSQKAMNNYQTQHKDPNVQSARVTMAGQTGLGGHSSQNSNSKQNANTTGGLSNINNATKK